MNEMERLIAALPRPNPGGELDARIDGLLNRPRRRNWAWPALAACIGIIGFFLGRWSTSAEISSGRAFVVRELPASAQDFRVIKVPLRDDQLAGMFVSVESGEGIFGQGPISTKVSTAP